MKSFLVLLIQWRAIIGDSGPLAHLGGKYHAGGLAAYSTVGLGQEPEDI